MKVNEYLKCPHCGEGDSHIFYLWAEMLTCEHCKKPFDIKTETVVRIIGKIPERNCSVCNTKFVSDSAYDNKVKCPNCGWNEDNYNL